MKNRRWTIEKKRLAKKLIPISFLKLPKYVRNFNKVQLARKKTQRKQKKYKKTNFSYWVKTTDCPKTKWEIKKKTFAWQLIAQYFSGDKFYNCTDGATKAKNICVTFLHLALPGIFFLFLFVFNYILKHRLLNSHIHSRMNPGN